MVVITFFKQMYSMISINFRKKVYSNLNEEELMCYTELVIHTGGRYVLAQIIHHLLLKFLNKCVLYICPITIWNPKLHIENLIGIPFR